MIIAPHCPHHGDALLGVHVADDLHHLAPVHRPAPVLVVDPEGEPQLVRDVPRHGGGHHELLTRIFIRTLRYLNQLAFYLEF